MDRRDQQNLMFGAITFLGVALIAGAFWVLREQHGFVRYRNDEMKFSISHPKDWIQKENVGGAAVIFYSPKENSLDIFQESVNVVVQDLSEKPMALKEYSDLAIKQLEVVFGENMMIQESGTTFIAGQTGHKLIFVGKGPGTELKYLSVWTIKGLKAYQVTYTSLASQYDRYELKVKRMLGSFQIQ